MASTRALRWTQPLDPYDTVDYSIQLTGRLIETNEAVQNFTLTPDPAATAAGLVIGSGSYAPALVTANGIVSLVIWFSIASAHQADAAFEDTGQVFDMTLQVTTTNAPARIRERTLRLQVCQQ